MSRVYRCWGLWRLWPSVRQERRSSLVKPRPDLRCSRCCSEQEATAAAVLLLARTAECLRRQWLDKSTTSLAYWVLHHQCTLHDGTRCLPPAPTLRVRKHDHSCRVSRRIAPCRKTHGFRGLCSRGSKLPTNLPAVKPSRDKRCIVLTRLKSSTRKRRGTHCSTELEPK